MIEYNYFKHLDQYILYRFRYYKNSIGFYPIFKGNFRELRDYIKNNKIKLKRGVKYGKKS